MPSSRRAPDGHLSRPLGERLIGSIPTHLVLGPWFDWIALRAIVKGYMPLSRAWAAAEASAGAIEPFLSDGGTVVVTRRLTQRILRAVEARRRACAAHDRHWLETFFGEGVPAIPDLVDAEVKRVKAADAFMMSRFAFLPAVRSMPPINWSLATPETVAARHGARRAVPEAAFPAPADAAVEESHRVPGTHGPEYWLRFASSVGGVGDTAWAHVFEPDGRGPWPTIVFLHGVCLEPEMVRSLPDAVVYLVTRGWRVIRPEAPWHGRRRPVGWFGGEPAFARGLLGLIDILQSGVAETGTWISWARGTGSPHVAIGGVSLGALTVQLVASAACEWPMALQPDGLMLVATTGNVVAAALRGGFPTALGMAERLAGAGWLPDMFESWRCLIEPGEHSVLAPDRIVMVLGETDTVTPFAGGLDLTRRWRVPAENLFIRRKGHFSVALNLLRNRTPFDRFVTTFQ